MAPPLSAIFTLLYLGTSAAFVAPSGNCLYMSRGFTAHRRSCAATAASSAAPARQRVLGPLFMADDEKVDPEILAKVKSIVVSQLAVEESQVVPEANFTQDLGADSLDTVELIMALEEGFDIEIEDEVAAEISTVKQAVEFISKSA